jgi:hypothetical protein
MLTGRVDAVIGVDTHKDQHTAAMVDGVGGEVATTSIPTTAVGYGWLLEWARGLEPRRRVWAVEATGSFGAGLSSFLLEAGEWVCEVDRPDKPARKRGAKSDEIDAVRAARQALQEKHLAQPRRRGVREGIRVLKLARQEAVDVRSHSLVQLKALLISAPELLRSRLRGLSGKRLIEACLSWSPPPGDDLELSATMRAMRSLAQRARTAGEEEEALHQELAALVAQAAPEELLGETGVGSVVAAQVICAWSHPGRLRSEAAFAMLGGSAPIPASSGQKQRYRLNPGGDRELNCALRTVVITRMAWEERTRIYFERRRREGKSDREIQRCLKRYIARHFFRILESSNRCLST